MSKTKEAFHQAFRFEVAEDSMVFFKEEPVESSAIIEEKNFCRCCYKGMSMMSEQFVINDTTMKAFEEITGLKITPVHISTSFCESCSSSIFAFKEFKQLALTRHQKFTELFLANDMTRLNLVHEINLNWNPFQNMEFEIKVEKEDSEQNNRKLSCASSNGDDCNSNDLFGEWYQDELSNHDEDLLCLLEPFPDAKMNTSRTCAVCKKKPKNMNKHKLRYHPIKCEICKFKCGDQPDMNIHMGSQHPTKPESQICPMCGKCLMDLENHIKRVHGKILECDICGFSTNHMSKLSNHIRGRHVPKTEQVKKNSIRKYTEEDVQLALRAIKNKEISAYAAARKYSIPKATFYDILNQKSKKRGPGCAPTLSPEQEKKIANEILLCAKRGTPKKRKDILIMAGEIAASSSTSKRIHSGVMNNPWFKNFLKRNPEVTNAYRKGRQRGKKTIFIENNYF